MIDVFKVDIKNPAFTNRMKINIAFIYGLSPVTAQYIEPTHINSAIIPTKAA